jgi:hypothetical protein
MRLSEPEVGDECTITNTDFFQLEELQLAIRRLKNHKSLGNCNISAEVIKAMVCPAMLTVLL